ncbi:MAG TPA: hypothetical protein VIU12_18080 [Chryseolinea sp.]
MDIEQNSRPHWNLPQRIVFRFLFSYLVLYILPFPLYYIPFSGYVFTPLHSLFAQLVETAGPLLFGKYYTPFHATGAGDTSFSYATACILLLLATVVTLGWSFLDGKRLAYGKLAAGLNILVRYYLAQVLLSYGFLKVFPIQFPTPFPGRLSETYGESSPMGLLWTFMGSSPGYVIFTGAGEALAGTLLLFRRTRLLGALLAAFIMSHVFALNLFYDVPVKLGSFHLLLMSLFLMAPDAHRLANMFLLNKPVDPEMPGLTIADKRLRWLRIGLKTGMIYFIFFNTVIYNWQMKKENDNNAREFASRTTAGEFEVLHFIINGDTLSASHAETRRWRSVRLGGDVMQITYMDGMMIPWHCAIRNGSKKIKVFSKDLTTAGDFSFEKHEEQLSIQGILNQDSIRIVSRRVSENPFLLLSREFHWISEEPFNK